MSSTAGLVAEFVFGLIVIGVTLRDVFDTVVVPGESKTSLRIVTRLLFGGLAILRKVRRLGAVPPWLAPTVLLLSFVGWMTLLVIGFGFVVDVLADWYDPRLPTFSQSLFVAGSSLVTVGLSETDATGPARWVNIAAGFCGLAVMTMAVTYLLGMQSRIARRDVGILKLTISAGSPPSAVELLERYAELGCRDELPVVLRKGRDWCADLLQSHASHPSLIYFRSIGTASGWPATLGTLVQLSVLFEMVIEEPGMRGKAILLREQALRAGSTLSERLSLPLPRDTIEVETAKAMMERLRAAGYSVHDEIDLSELVTLADSSYAASRALARHLGIPTSRLFC
jgi:hypothetical protein